MKIFKLHRQQQIAAPLEKVFEFFNNPENLSRITPSSLGFRIITPQPLKMRACALIDYTVRISGIKVHWRTLISDYEPPYRFVDVQLKGPYSYWYHEHRFEEKNGGTMMHDMVHYAMPFGWAGRIVHYLFVKRQLKKIFDHRSSVIEHLFKNEKQQG